MLRVVLGIDIGDAAVTLDLEVRDVARGAADLLEDPQPFA